MSDSEKSNDTHIETSRKHPEEERDSSLPPGAVERLLSDPQRRVLCQYLVESPVSTMDELIELLVREDDSCTRERALIRLHHVYLPMLKDHGLLTYEPRSETVRYWGHEVLEQRLELCRHVSQAENGTTRSDDTTDHPRIRL